jgi:hypothetical protein
MMSLEFIRWWYTRGWSGALLRLKDKLAGIEQAFSVGILLRTLFSPWRRIITYPGGSLAEYFRAFIDNLVSRFVGFFVRISVLFAAGIVTILFGIVALVAVVLWPILPPLAVGLIVWGLLA